MSNWPLNTCGSLISITLKSDSLVIGMDKSALTSLRVYGTPIVSLSIITRLSEIRRNFKPKSMLQPSLVSTRDRALKPLHRTKNLMINYSKLSRSR